MGSGAGRALLEDAVRRLPAPMLPGFQPRFLGTGEEGQRGERRALERSAATRGRGGREGRRAAWLYGRWPAEVFAAAGRREGDAQRRQRPSRRPWLHDWREGEDESQRRRPWLHVGP